MYFWDFVISTAEFLCDCTAGDDGRSSCFSWDRQLAIMFPYWLAAKASLGTCFSALYRREDGLHERVFIAMNWWESTDRKSADSC